MKKLITLLITIVTVAFVAASCTSTGKMGCPTNTVSNKPFRA